MVDYSKEVELFLIDLGFEKIENNTVKHKLYKHKIIRQLRIQNNNMYVEYEHYGSRTNKKFDINDKFSVLEAYTHCVEFFGRKSGESSVKGDIVDALGLESLIKSSIEDYMYNNKEDY